MQRDFAGRNKSDRLLAWVLHDFIRARATTRWGAAKREMETVTFSIGGLVLGSGLAQQVLTPVEIVTGAIAANDPAVIKAYLGEEIDA